MSENLPPRLPHSTGLRRTAAALCLWPILAGAAVAAAVLQPDPPPAPQAQADPQAQVLAQQMADYQADRPKSILDLQPFRTTQTARLADGHEVTLISLNPNVNSWFLLQIGAGTSKASYHIQNPAPSKQTITLTDGPDPQLSFVANGKTATCAPWANTDQTLLKARESRLPFAPICGGHLYLRNPATGYATRLEETANFIRKNIIGGELLVGFVKNMFYKDAFRIVAPDDGTVRSGADKALPSGPPDAQGSHYLVRSHMGLGLITDTPGHIALGQWYPLEGIPGVFASAMQPAAIDPKILNGPGKTNPLDRVESHSMDYFAAFDLSQFDMGYAVGTAHPSLDWSPRPPASVRPPGMPGPDGVASPAPLVPLGMLSPALAPRVVATFAAGFKREHSAFMTGPLSLVNHGSHYGFIQQGVILSKLQPGLSTIYVLDDGAIHMKTWTAADDSLLPHIRFARQNGVPLLERNPAGGTGLPGALVPYRLEGNWSGSADNRLRTLRAGACMIDHGDKRYLVYAFFSTATPSAMARTFESYGCTYAMLLDMNALEHTYFAVYDRQSGSERIEHLVPGMQVVDRKDGKGHRMARFVDYPDNRDFFYMLRRRPG